MRHKFQQVLDKIHDFLNGHDQPDQTESNSLTSTIEEAIQKQTAVHLILSETSFTGDIIKYDQQRQQIIVKNFAKNVTRIIRIAIFNACDLSLQPSKQPKKIDLRKSEM